MIRLIEFVEEPHAFTQKVIHLENDIGLWDDIFRRHTKSWIAKSSEDSGMIHGNEGYHRYCYKSFFTRIYPLTGESAERILLCYSPSRGKVFCFACMLPSRRTSSFIKGFNDWKHADERNSSHERERRSHGSPSNGNYLAVMEVLAKYDSFFAQHITMFVNKGRGHILYLSSSKVLDIINEEL